MDRKELIERLRDYPFDKIKKQAADMLEADGKAVPQEPTGKQSLQVAKHRTTGWMAPVDRYAVPVLFNPYTGEPRDARDVASDPHGILIVPPGKVEMLAEPVKTKEQATAFIESKLWEAIDMHGAFPNALIDSRTWEHLSCYAPLPKPQPQRPRLTDEEIDAVIREHRDGMSYDFYPAYRAVSRAIEKKVRGEAR